MTVQEIKAWDGSVIKWPFDDKPAREVQLVALAKGYGREGFAYFMRQRLGKTWTAFAEYMLLRAEGKVDWCVIICPNSLKQQWLDAIEEVEPYLPIHIYESQSVKKAEYFFSKSKKGGVFIINYESLKAFMRNNLWQNINTLRTYIVADESTKIKEFSKKMTKAALEFSSFCAYKRILTGKPRANSNADLWAQLKFINCTDRNFHQHKYTFSMVGGYRGRQVVKDINVEKLKTEMAPHCYIAEDKYIKGFDKIYEPMRFVELSDSQKTQYQEMENELLIELSADVKITAPIALVKYLRLQQISSGIAGDVDGLQHNIIDPFKNPRIQVVLDLLESEIDGKVIIPCRFKLSIENLKLVLTKAGYKCATMVGGMGIELDAQKLMFNTDPECTVLLAQCQVLSFGHTLCGPDDNPCNDMIFYENDFSLLNRAQAESRPEKYERGSTISYWDMYASKMDKHIISKLVAKEDGSMALMNYAREYGIFGNTREIISGLGF